MNGTTALPDPPLGAPPKDLFLYVIAAIMVKFRRRILDDCHSAEELMIEFTMFKNGHGIKAQDVLRTAFDIRKSVLQKAANQLASPAA